MCPQSWAKENAQNVVFILECSRCGTVWSSCHLWKVDGESNLTELNKPDGFCRGFDIQFHGRPPCGEIWETTATATKNLKIKPSKTHLGQVVDQASIHTDPANVKAMQEVATPTCIGDIRTVLGYTKYYRYFISEYAELAALYVLPKKKSSR